MQRQDTTDQCKRHIHNSEHGVLHIAKSDEQDQEDSQQAKRHYPCKCFPGTLCIFKLSIPGHFIPLWQLYLIIHDLPDLLDRTTQIPATNGEFDRYIPCIVITVNERRTSQHFSITDLLYR